MSENSSPARKSQNSAASVTAATPSDQTNGYATPVQVSVKTLLDAGAHFGHQTHRWNPKMLPFIYTERNGVHILNLDITMKQWQKARKYIVDTVSRGGNVLFVATKPAAREIVEREAKRAGAHFVTQRWLGGTITNFETIKNSIERMRKLEDYLVKADAPDTQVKLKKKEKLMISKNLFKLEQSLGGIRNMRRRPELLFIVDISKEEIAVQEARRLHIPVIALVDTNVDPTAVQFPIPSNDDANKTISLFLAAAADAVIEGRQVFESRRPKEESHGSSSSNMRSNEASAAPAV